MWVIGDGGIEKMEDAFELLRKKAAMLPEGTSFWVDITTFSASSLLAKVDNYQEAQKVKNCFPSTVWKREWQESLNQWRLSAKFDNIRVIILGFRKHPHCEKVVKKRVVSREKPVEWEEVEEEVEVVEFDCSVKDEE